VGRRRAANSVLSTPLLAVRINPQHLRSHSSTHVWPPGIDALN
jgi:hypothetical protein